MTSNFDNFLNSDFVNSINNTIIQTQKTINDANDIDYSACKREKDLREQQAAIDAQKAADTKLKNEINSTVDEKNKNVMGEINNLNDINTTYKNVINSSKNVIELYYNYYNKNTELEEEINDLGDVIRANERKTFYNEPDTTNIQKWNFFSKKIYWILFVVFIIICFFFYEDYSVYYKSLLVLVFLIFPFIFMPIIKLIIAVVKYVISLFPTNVYTAVKGNLYNTGDKTDPTN